MTRHRILAIALSIPFALGLGFSLAPAASAAELTITDPARDNAGAGLDILSGELDSSDYAIGGTVSFRSDREGTLIVGLKARERALVRLVVKHRTDGDGRSFLIDRSGAVVDCQGLVVDWDSATTTVAFTIPSTCLWSGNYGAVRPWYLTEGLHSGSDVDAATTTEFVPRG